MKNKKILESEQLIKNLSSIQRPIVMTNGVFDILHVGHVNYLYEAAKLGASLIVAINTDDSVRGLNKAPDRPINNQIERAYMLAGLEAVNYVTFFSELNPFSLIRNIKPDFYVKGGDYNMNKMIETDLIKEWGGVALAMPFLEGYSTTRFLTRIRNAS